MQPGTAFHTGLPSWLQAVARCAELVRLFELMRYFRILFGGLAFKVLDRFFFQDRFSSKRLSAFLTNAIIFFTFSSLFLIVFFFALQPTACLFGECCLSPFFCPGRLVESHDKCWRRYRRMEGSLCGFEENRAEKAETSSILDYFHPSTLMRGSRHHFGCVLFFSFVRLFHQLGL